KGPAAEQELESAVATGDARQMGKVNGLEHADIDFRIAERRLLPGDTDVTENRQVHAAAARRAGHRRDRRFAEIALRLMQIDVERLDEFENLLAGFAEQHREVETGAEVPGAGAREHDGARRVIGRRSPQGGDDGADHVEAQRIDRRTIENDVRDASVNRIAHRVRHDRATSIAIRRDLDMREGGEHARHVARRRHMQIRRIELAVAGHAQKPHRAYHLVLEQFEHAHDAGLAARGQPVALHAAETDEIGAHGLGLDDVAAAIEAAVDNDLGADGGRLDDFRQHVGRAAAVIELPAAVIGDEDEVDAVIEAELGILRGGEALDGERNLEFRFDALDGAPVERLLEFAARGAAPATGDVALGDVALAPAVMRGVDGETEHAVFAGDGARHIVVDPGGVAAY